MFDSSDDDDWSDYEESVRFNRVVVRRVKSVRNRPNHFVEYDDQEFIQRFRLTKQSASFVLDMIGPQIMNSTERNDAIKIEQMLLIALRFYATGGMLMTIGDLNGVVKSTVSKIVTKVSHSIALLRETFIYMPKSKTDIQQSAQNFYKIAKFPNVVAAIDCTHVKIISPGGDTAELFRNRKGFYSINVQTMCDADLKITNIVARWQGSAHDSNIFRNSRVYAEFESGKFGKYFILGDGGYPNKKYLMTPLLNPNSPEENLYNESQIRTRNCVERSYGVWKKRFPVLSLGIRLKFEKVQSIIVACAVLHNICCINNDMCLPKLDDAVEEAIDFVSSVPRNAGTINDRTNIVRRGLINNYFKQLL